jgi:hypothetical protein
MNEIKIQPVGSGFIIYFGEDIFPASTAFICNKIVSKITREIEQLSGMRDHEYSAGKLNFKGASKEKIEAKSRAIETESVQEEVSSVRKNSLKKS